MMGDITTGEVEEELLIDKRQCGKFIRGLPRELEYLLMTKASCVDAPREHLYAILA